MICLSDNNNSTTLQYECYCVRVALPLPSVSFESSPIGRSWDWLRPCALPIITTWLEALAVTVLATPISPPNNRLPRLSLKRPPPTDLSALSSPPPSKALHLFSKQWCRRRRFKKTPNAIFNGVCLWEEVERQRRRREAKSVCNVATFYELTPVLGGRLGFE